MAKKLTKGLFIAFEGPEGCGKSTQSRLLHEDLLSFGYDVIHTMEPGGTPLGLKIRDILLEKDDLRMDKKAELFLFEADRAQHIEEVISPALEERKIVICDRFNIATYAYQGYGLGLEAGFIENIDSASRGDVKADLTILLDIDVDTGLSRAKAVGSCDRMEKREKAFHERVRSGYLDLAEKFSEKIKVIKVSGNVEEVHSRVKKEVYGFISRYKRPE
ncbi:MAG: dTMP kinase [Candidatus Omnitrophota bacterium]